jgi:hypothetical protein
MGASTCALFLSVKYHVLKPTYIYGRIEQVRRASPTYIHTKSIA